MKKQELLPRIDRELLDKLFGFCCRRTASAAEAQELCSDIAFELCRIGNSEGEIGGEASGDEALYAFIWQVARNVYADYSERRAFAASRSIGEDSETVLSLLSDEEEQEERLSREQDDEALRAIYHRIANLTAAYRAVMIGYYLDGKSVRRIADELDIPENTVRQRLFSARETVRKEVTNMEAIKERPTSLTELSFFQTGSGDPFAGDPRDLVEREIPKHIVWLCRNRALSARQIADELNIPMVYIEDELRLLTRGLGYSKYAAMIKTDGGKYMTNYILLSAEEFEAGRAHITDHIPALCDLIADYIDAHRQDYLSAPYLNHRVEWNDVVWQHISPLAHKFGELVIGLLQTEHLADVKQIKRPFVVVGHEAGNTSHEFCGWDGIDAMNICGVPYVKFETLYTRGLRAHFHCGHNIAKDVGLQFAIRAIEGLPIAALCEHEQEQAARAIRDGLILREGDMLYTRILAMEKADRESVFLIDDDIKEAMRPMADLAARGMADWIRKTVPAHLLGDYVMLSNEVTTGVFSALLPRLVASGVLTIPEGGMGSEGCWMTLER